MTVNATMSEKVVVGKIDSHVVSSALAYHQHFNASLLSSISYYLTMTSFAIIYHHIFQNLLNLNIFHTNILSSLACRYTIVSFTSVNHHLFLKNHYTRLFSYYHTAISFTHSSFHTSIPVYHLFHTIIYNVLFHSKSTVNYHYQQ